VASQCPIETLDTLVDAGLPPPGVIRMDVEGAELEVVHGAQRILREFGPAIVAEADVGWSASATRVVI
jgi:FkbM family methyltransferase